MAFITGSLGGISGGVSQQPDILRYPGQCTAQENMEIDLVRGLRRRGAVDRGTNLGTSYSYGSSNQFYFHWFTLEDKQYIAVLTASDIKVFDLSGVEYPVYGTSYTSYMGGLTSQRDISSVQVGEYNLFANRSKVCAMKPHSTTESDYATIWVKGGMDWGVTYTINYGQLTAASFTTPPGDVVDATTIEKINSDYIASVLSGQLSAFLTSTDYDVVLDGNFIKLYRAHRDNSFLSTVFTVDDGLGGNNISITINEANALDDLPPRSTNGHWVHVSGKSSSSLDDYYMKYVKPSVWVDGKWEETYLPLEDRELDPTTMPHALIKTASGYFFFTPLDGASVGGSIADPWIARNTGNAESNPEPVFVGKSINSMIMVQNRLAFITEDHINLSKTRHEFDFFSDSALAAADTDPIEISTPGNKIANLFAAKESDQFLVVLGEDQQFALPLKSALTTSTAVLVPTTSYAVNNAVDPVASGSGVYFAYKENNHTGIREYSASSVESSATINTANSITSNVNQYIPEDVHKLVVDTQNSKMYVLLEDSKDVYVYKFLIQNGQKVISAWYKYSFLTPIFDIRIVEDTTYMVTQVNNDLRLLRLTDNPSFLVDYGTSTIVIEGVADFSFWEVSDLVTAEDITVVALEGPYVGLQLQVESFVGGILTLKEKSLFEGLQVAIGVKYTSLYTPTMPVIRDRNEKAVQVDRLTVNDLLVTINESGPLKAIVSAPYYDDTTQELTGREIGGSFVVGEYPPSSRIEQVSVWHDARHVDVTLQTDSHMDMIIQAIEYKASYTRRGGRY